MKGRAPNKDEKWSLIPGYGGLYEASSFGRVKSLARVVKKKHSRTGKVCDYFYSERILSPHYVKGYLIARFGYSHKKYAVQVGRLVLMAFEGIPSEGQECCHNNGTPDDNCLSNLRWDTHLENNRDRVRHGTYKTGEDHHFNKYSKNIINGVASGAITKRMAMDHIGISNTHYYRILRCNRS